MLTPEQRYTKAIDIPPFEWAKLPFIHEVNFSPQFGSLTLKISILDATRMGSILISKDRCKSHPYTAAAEKEAVIAFIDSYAPEVELVWEERVDGEILELYNDIALIRIMENDCGGWSWMLFANGTAVKFDLNGENPKDSTISAAKAAAGELIKSVLKPG